MPLDRSKLSPEQLARLYPPGSFERKDTGEPIDVIVGRDAFTKKPAYRYIYVTSAGKRIMGSPIPIPFPMLMLYQNKTREIRRLKQQIAALEARLKSSLGS